MTISTRFVSTAEEAQAVLDEVIERNSGLNSTPEAGPLVAIPGGFTAEKTDPFAFTCEIPPKSAAVTWDLGYQWNDSDWMASRGAKAKHDKPTSIYEVHLGSWMREADPPYHSLNYREVGPKLAAYCKDMGFTHVELLPITEHPFFASWGYQTTGYFAATSRYGTPADLMYPVDTLHQAGVAAVFGPGTNIPAAARKVLGLVAERRGAA